MFQRYIYKVMILSMGLGVLSFGQVPVERDVYVKIDIYGVGQESLQELKSMDVIRWWVELEDQLLVRMPASGFQQLSWKWILAPYRDRVDDSALMVVSSGHAADASEQFGKVLARGGRFAVVLANTNTALVEQKQSQDEHLGCHRHTMPFKPNTVLAAQSLNRTVTPTKKRTAIDALVAEVNAQRWFDALTVLASYDRFTGTQSLDDAMQWMKTQFESLPNLQVSLESFNMPDGTEQFNLVGYLEGLERPDDLYIIGAHFDAIATRDGSSFAPGAEDNASGSAGVLEMARIFTEHPPKASIIFILFTGEELGLWGSRSHAAQLLGSGESARVQAMLNMDMIGYDGDQDYDVLLETDTSGSFLLDAFSAAAATYTDLRVVTSLNPFGSDHVSYLNNGMPALLVIENDWDIYPGYHRSSDTADRLDLIQGYETLKMNVAAMAEMVGVAYEDNIPAIFEMYQRR